MPRSTVDLEALVIRSPCAVPWEAMSGDAARRFCSECRLHVHGFSQMTRAEIGELLRTTDGNCCKRIWRRPDGRIVTKDCGRAVRALRRRLRVVGAAFAGFLGVLGFGGCGERREAGAAPQGEPKPAAPEGSVPEQPPVAHATVTTGR